MTTQTANYPETNVSSARKAGSDGRSETESCEGSDIKQRVRNMVDSGKAHVEEWKGGLQDGIRENPIRSVLIATAVGTVIGLLLGRRSR